MENLIHRFFRWFAIEEDSNKSKIEVNSEKLEKQKRHLKDQKKIEALNLLLKVRVPGFVGYNVIENKIAVFVEPEVGYGQYSSYLIFKDDKSKRVKVLRNLKCDALDGIAIACKWSDVIFPIPGDARIFYGQRDFLPVFKQGDTFEKLMIEAGLQGESSNV